MSRFDAKINFLQIQTFKNKLPTNPNFLKKNSSFTIWISVYAIGRSYVLCIDICVHCTPYSLFQS